MTKFSENNYNNGDYDSKQEARNNFWYSIALLVGNIGIIVKVLVELISDRSKPD